MNNYQAGGLIIAAIIAAIGSMKIELIKEIVRKMTSDKKQINIYSFALLAVLCIVPAVAGFTIPANESPKEEPAVQNNSSQKSDAEVVSDGVKDAVVLGNEIAENVKKEKQEKQKNYEATRPERWVYQIGDEIGEKNKDGLEDAYKQLSGINHVCLFKDGSSLFFFVNEEHAKDDLSASLDDFKSKLSSPAAVRVINLMEYCDMHKPSLSNWKKLKLGKRKEKESVSCYECR